MKYLFAIVLAIGCAIGAQAQEYDGVAVKETAVRYNTGNYDTLTRPTLNYKKTKEWKRYQTLQAVGWSMLGTGIPCFLGGIGCIINGLGAAEEGSKNASNLGYTGIALLCTGSVMTVVSIPILISAYHYRSKARKMGVSLSAITTPKVGGSNMAYNYAPALSVAITF